MAWTFWAAAVAMAAAVAGLLTLAMLRARAAAEPAAAYDLRVYRDQMAEIDRDLARGVIAPEEAERLRAEIGRRLLDADRALARATATPGGTAGGRGLALAVGLAVLAGGGALYLRVGAPGYPDLPLARRLELAEERRASRPTQAEAEAALPPAPATAPADPRFLELMDRLRATVAERPDDLRGLDLLARNEAALGNYAAARDAQAHAVAVKGDQATAEDLAALAELMILAAGGLVTAETEAVLQRALTIDPRNGTARYYSGLMLVQLGRYDLAFRLWRALLEESPPDAPWTPPIRARIEEVAARAGVDYTPPAPPGAPAGRGPSAEDMAAAADMTEEDRQAMIRGMVEGLAERLATEGGGAPDWARLIGALGVLGDTDRARAIWAEAQGVFADRPEDLAAVRAAARQAGVAE